jgi:hypothetical protein
MFFQLVKPLTSDEEFGQGVSYCVILLSRREDRKTGVLARL